MQAFDGAIPTSDSGTAFPTPPPRLVLCKRPPEVPPPPRPPAPDPCGPTLPAEFPRKAEVLLRLTLARPGTQALPVRCGRTWVQQPPRSRPGRHESPIPQEPTQTSQWVRQ